MRNRRRLPGWAVTLALILAAACSDDSGEDSGPAGDARADAPRADGDGGAATVTARITATPESGDAVLSVELDGCASSSENGAIVHFSWQLPDGRTRDGPVIVEDFAAGAQHVALTVTDETGATASATATIDVAGETVAPAWVGDTTGHPRLFFDAAHVADLRARVARTPILGAEGHRASYVTGYLLRDTWQSASWYRANEDNCKGIMGSALQSGVSQPVNHSRAVSDCLTTIAAAAQLEPDPAKATAHAEGAIDGLLHLADVWPTDGADNAGFGRWVCGNCGATGGTNLCNGELLFSVGFSYDLLYPWMTGGERDAIRALLLREVRWLYDTSVNKTTWWAKDNGNNWQAVIHGGFGVAALALVGEPGVEQSESDPWLARAVDRVQAYLDSNFDADGVNYEDIGHAGYGLRFAATFLAALRNVTGEDVLGYRDGLIGKALRYYVHAMEPTRDGFVPNDGVNRNYTTFPLLLLGASLLRDGHAQWVWDHMSGADRPAANDFPFKVGGDGAQSQLLGTAFFFDDTVRPLAPDGHLPAGKVYPDFGRALLRSGWADPDGLLLAIECGIYGSHGRPNQGHFFLAAYGEHMLDHAGGGSSDGYNVLVVDGSDQARNGDDGSFTMLARTRRWLVGGPIDFVRYETLDAYTQDLSVAGRDFVLVRATDDQGAYALIYDRLRSTAQHSYRFYAHAGDGFSWSEVDATHYRAQKDDDQLDVVAVLPSAPEMSIDGAALRISKTGTDVDFLTALLPGDGAHPTPSHALAASSLTVGADRVTFDAGGAAADGEVQSDGPLLLVRRQASAVRLAALLGGSQLTVAGASWVQASTALELIAAHEADRAMVWTGAVSAGGAADLSVGVPAGIAGEVLVVLDGVVQGVQAPSDDTVALTGIDLASPHAIELRPAGEAPPGCQ